MSLAATYLMIEQARAQGYRDRMAHKIGRTQFVFPNEQRAYEEGVAAAERDMGFSPVRQTGCRTDVAPD